MIRTTPDGGYDPLGLGPSPGELATLIAGNDWSASSLGPIAGWTPSLRTTLRMILPAQAQIVLFWGADYIAFYNDAYRPTIGDKHPRALGRPAAENWSELWSDLEPLLRSVRDTGQTYIAKDRPFYIERHGYGEEVNFDISYSAILGDEPGAVDGVLCIVSETTERVKTQRHRDEEMRRLAQMFDQAPGFMAMLSGPSHVFTLTNRAYQKLIGDRTVIGKAVREALPEVSAQGFVELLDGVYTSGTPFAGRGIRVTLASDSATGDEERLLDFVYQPIKDANGATTGIFVEGSDVTERHRAVKAQRDSEERLRLATEGGSIGTWDYNPATGHLNWDARCKALFGLPPDAEITYEKSFLLGLHPDDRRMAQEAVESSLKPNGAGSYEVEYRTVGPHDGCVRWLSARGKASFENGRAVRFLGTVVDISKIKQAEAVIADLNRTLESQVAQRTQERDRIWNVSQDLLGVADRNGVWSSVNPAWTRVLGWPSDQLVGRTTEWLEPDGEDARTLTELSKLDTGIATLAFDSRLRAKDGTYRFLSWSAVSAGEQIYCVARDVTEARAAAAALQEAEERLRHAQKMETVGQLSGGIAHDFNNLLQIVTGNLETLQRNLPTDNARLRRAADNAMTGARRAATLTQRLLAFSRRQPLAPTAVNPNKLVAGMSELLQRTLGETIEIETVLAPDAWMIEADVNQLESAILNLVVNARDAMPGGGKLTIETGNSILDEAYVAANADVGTGRYLVISISDAGTGIAKDTLARVFEPFFTTKEPGKGTGLGLSMVYGFVKQSGGHVKIYSEVGHGTSVKIYLPRHAADAREETAETAPSAPHGGRNETILVCEDDDDVRAYSVDTLRELGYRVLEAHDGPSALRLLKRQEGPIDLLFTDVVLPGGMTGADLAGQAVARMPELRVLFTTGYARNAIVHHGRLDPGVELVTKPFTYAALAIKVREILDK